MSDTLAKVNWGLSMDDPWFWSVEFVDERGMSIGVDERTSRVFWDESSLF